jgi:hypothetical protein
MMTTAPHNAQGPTAARVRLMACALRAKTWQLGCTPGPGQKPRERGVPARKQARGLPEGAPATPRLGGPATAPVVRWDAAGRAGFWLHRFFQAQGLTNPGVDAAAIAVKRRQPRAQSDGVALRKLCRRLRRWHQGAREVGRVVQGPAVAAADPRPLHRDLASLKPARASTTARIQGLLSRQGLRLTPLQKLPAPLDALWLGEGAPRPRGRRQRLLRV